MKNLFRVLLSLRELLGTEQIFLLFLIEFSLKFKFNLVKSELEKSS